MSTSSQPGEWDRLVTKIGLLTLAAGVLEAAIMAMHCKARGRSESDLKSRLNHAQRDGLKKAVKALDWPEEKKADLVERLSAIAALDKRRNAFIHLAAGIVSDGSIRGVPVGSVVDLRTVGFGGVNLDGNSWEIGVVGKKLDMNEIDNLIDDIQHARLGLTPYMELVDKITHPQRSVAELADRLKKGELL